ncbi:condensation domain-containing protein [Nocardiopsis alkaliphila]|uniref:condensation domain-containing protein n=1 Tax=Nocardiopsis alkaliphila TaxID=225762 RepID=UPI00034BDEB5|nr:condensation domain-containing protein [Nocardiopsis alkaliphila]
MFDSKDYTPLAAVQEHFWSPKSGGETPLAQTECASLYVQGDLDRSALEHAVLRLLGRHEILRSVFVDSRSGPMTYVPAPPARAPLTWKDFTSEPSDPLSSRVRAQLRDFADAGVDLSTGPPLRFVVMDLADGCVLALAVHHLVADATTVRFVLAELDQDYRNITEGGHSRVAEPELQYGDFVEWERNAFLPLVEKKDGEFWKQALTDAPAALDLRPDRPRPPFKRDLGRRTRHTLRTRGSALLDFARVHNTTPYVVSLAAFAALASRSTGAEDLVLGVLTSNRSTPQLERLVGQLSNTVPLRLRTDGDPDPKTLIARCSDVVTDAIEHGGLPLGHIIEQVAPERRPGRTPLIQHLFLPKVDAVGDLSFGGFPTRMIEVDRERGRFDTITEMEATPQEVRLWIEHDTAIHTPAGIEALVSDYDRLLAAWIADPGVRLSRLSLEGPPIRSVLRPNLAAALDITSEDTVLVNTSFSESETVHGAIDTAGALRWAPGQAINKATIAAVPAAEFGKYARDDGIPVLVVDGPVSSEDLGLLGEDDRRQAIRLFRSAQGALCAADITDLPHKWPLLLHVDGLPAHIEPTDGAASPFTPGTLIVDSQRSSLQARWNPEGAMEVISGIPFLLPSGEESTPPGRHGDDPLLDLLCELWAELLEAPAVGPGDDFFVLGGHSMVATRTITELHDVLGVEVGIRTLFENPTPALLADRIRAENPGVDGWMDFVSSTSESSPAEETGHTAYQETEGEPLPLLASQRQLWLAEQSNPGALTHTIPLLLRIDGPLDEQALRGAVRDVLRRQPGLRAEFGQHDGEPFQRIVPLDGYDVPLTDLSALPASEKTEQNRLLEEETAHGGFDISTAPLLRSRLVRLSNTSHTLHLLFHHLVTDEVSMSVFMRELSEFYRARVEGDTPELPDLRLGFTDLALDEQKMLAGREGQRLRRFWRRELVDTPPSIAVPTDQARPEKPAFVGEFLERRGSGEVLATFDELARRHRTTRFTVFCATVLILLHKLTGQTDLVVGVPTENRSRSGSELLIGCFLNVVPIRVDCSADPNLAECIDRTSQALLRSYEHQALPFADIIETAAPERSPGVHPIYQVTCELQLDGWLPLNLPGCRFSYEMLSHGTARYDMSFHALLREDSVSIMLELNTELWNRQTGLERIDQLLRLLEQVAVAPESRLSQVRI